VTRIRLALFALVIATGACGKPAPAKVADQDHDHDDHAPTNRIPIPAAVRTNLGVTFAKVEPRAVAQTARYAGRFDAAPDARREYRAPVEGRLSLVAKTMADVRPGDVLFRLDAPRLRDLRRSIAELTAARGEAQAKLDGMPGFRAAHEKHEAALQKAVEAWRSRTSELEAVAAAGGGRNEALASARAELASAEAAFAETVEKDADMAARERELTATREGLDLRIRLLREELAALARGFGAATGDAKPEEPDAVVVRAEANSAIERIVPADGAWVAAGEPVVVALDPTRVIFRADAPQADLTRLAAGGPARIVPPSGGGAAAATLAARFRLQLAGDPDARTIGLLAEPDGPPPPWARPGVVAALETAPRDAAAELAIPRAAVLRDGLVAIYFRRDPKDPDAAIRVEADLGADDGRYVVLKSGVREGDEVVVDGAYQLLLATSGSSPKGGHFHADGTFHADEDHK
jgi:hypothetical protein